MWARIIENCGIEMVAEVIDFDPAGVFLPEVAEQFVPAEEGMVYMAEKRDGVWVPPPAPEPEPVVEPEPEGPKYRTKISRAEYYGLFTPVEEAKIRLTAKIPVTIDALNAAVGLEQQRLMAVAALAVMLARTDTLGPDKVFDLHNPQVGEGLALLVQLGLLTETRKTEILKGVPDAGI